MGTPTTLSSGSVMDAYGTRYCNGAKARNILGYEPRVGIEEGIRISCEEYAQRLKQIETDKEKLISSNGHFTNTPVKKASDSISELDEYVKSAGDPISELDGHAKKVSPRLWH
ncbi:hypothetical protein MMC08_007496 [Hypocenomyce scalaris]|nr:hypothetical protein [Hypocenomyce scalaris]